MDSFFFKSQSRAMISLDRKQSGAQDMAGEGREAKMREGAN